ncbi:unnamed protein product, partial [Adineta steineri]
QHFNNHSSSSLRRPPTLVKRNGKQFIIEFKERTERRYVQYNDDQTHQKRIFEVTDCIPYRTIKPYMRESQSSLNNDSLSNSLHSSLPSIPKTRLESNKLSSSNSHRNSSAYIRMSFSTPPLYQSYYQPTKQSTNNSDDYHIQHSQSNSFNYTTINPQKTPNQYSSKPFHIQSSSFRAHTPSSYDHVGNSFETDSINSNYEFRGKMHNTDTNQTKRTNSSLCYQTIGKYQSSTLQDSFAHSATPIDSHQDRVYPDINNYVIPAMNNRTQQQLINSDFISTPTINKQSHQNEFPRDNKKGTRVSFI